MSKDEAERGRKQLEEIIGLGAFDAPRPIPGTVAVPGREFRYVSCDGETNIKALFGRVTRAVEPALPRGGAVITENCILTVPDGGRFFGLSYKGDVEGWRRQIEQGARLLGKALASIERDKFVLQDGRKFPLSECDIEFF